MSLLSRRCACKTRSRRLTRNALLAIICCWIRFKRALPGGTGRTFDWKMIPPLAKPFFLAGGLHAGNVMQTAGLGAFCLDMSSSVETEGKKGTRGRSATVVEMVRRMPT